MSNIQEALEHIRETGTNDTERGFAFECLVKIFLENDATQRQQFSEVWHYEIWAKGRSVSQQDIGIDLVAKLRDEEGYCAVQCKFYQPEHSISKADLDSFISASNTPDFKRLLLVDTSTQSIGKNAQSVFDNLTQNYTRIQLSELEESRIDWMTYVRAGEVRQRSKKELRDHQIQALEAIREGLEEDDRGKLIMACGTGKTFASLRIAEDLAGNGKRVLYMVPSLALMSQTVREWKNDAVEDFTAFSACSDDKVGRRKGSDDTIEVNLHDLAFPATTDAEKLAQQIKNADSSKMTVVFSTYHSIDVISRAQHEFYLGEFDLIICDEAHRTTGATLSGDDESNFVRIHDDENVKSKKRLYMTATPRIYGEKARQQAEQDDVALASMDDEETYGKILFHRGFGWAVQNNLLTDYKVVVLAMDEQLVSYRAQRSLESDSQLVLDDATKMVGCYKALAKIGMDEKPEISREPMRQALAFCQNIKLSQMFASEFGNVIEEYTANEEVAEEFKTDLEVQLHHVDGTFNAEQRNEKLSWLREDVDKNICRVLTNARCLSEGIDVPALDAIMFLHPRKSQIDVVQSVGRVMRKAEGKDLGYVIIPIAVAPGISPEKALNDNKKYQVVWQILNALRAHDERLDRDINKLSLGEDISDRIEIISGVAGDELEATTSVVDDIKPKVKGEKENEGEQSLGDETEEAGESEEPEQLSFILSDLSQAIKAKIVDKCGTRDYWENWANDISKIAKEHIDRINGILVNTGTPEREAFDAFLEAIRNDLNPEISESDAIEMLAQHIITRPVFDSLFLGNRFTAENAVSKAMEVILDRLYDRHIDAEAHTLERFYESVKLRAEGIVTAAGRQTLIKDLYNRFFQNAFPLMTQRLGIVYTPTEVVDFIIHSVNDVLQSEFGKTLGSQGVHILDPFTGTGTFITRLLQSGLIEQHELEHKYRHEIHANEILLLAYYIAAINIEAVYHDMAPKDAPYRPFEGICLTDTFQLYEQEQDQDMVAKLLPDNSERRSKQKALDIRVIMGNPPYSAGQRNANDNAANIKYPNLDMAIRDSYANQSSAANKNALYDSYIRAIRWATDRIKDKGDDVGVVAFVMGSAWIERSFADGLRKCLAEEFSNLYVLHLRGDIRKNMLSKGAAKEGQNIFRGGSMTGISIAVLVRNPEVQEFGKIHFHNIGDDLTTDNKREILGNFKSIDGITKAGDWQRITPDHNHDWLDQVDRAFEKFIVLGDKKKMASSIFENYSLGVVTNRDPWCVQSSKSKLESNMRRLVENYQSELVRKISAGFNGKKVEGFINSDPRKYSWTRALKEDFKREKPLDYSEGQIVSLQYRPFTKQWQYFSPRLNEMISQMPRIFPDPEAENRVICVSGVGARAGFSALMVDALPCLDMVEKGQCFPLKLYEPPVNGGAAEGDLLAGKSTGGPHTRDGISNAGLAHFQAAYPVGGG